MKKETFEKIESVLAAVRDICVDLIETECEDTHNALVAMSCTDDSREATTPPGTTVIPCREISPPHPLAHVAPVDPTPELDLDGVPWDSRIHSDARVKKTNTGYWKKRRGVDATTVAEVMRELRAAGYADPAADPAAPAPPVVPAAPAPPVVPAAPAPPVVPAAPAPEPLAVSFIELVQAATQRGVGSDKLDELAQKHGADSAAVLITPGWESVRAAIYTEIVGR